MGAHTVSIAGGAEVATRFVSLDQINEIFRGDVWNNRYYRAFRILFEQDYKAWNILRAKYFLPLDGHHSVLPTKAEVKKATETLLHILQAEGFVTPRGYISLMGSR